jgi:hypothetical protein
MALYMVLYSLIAIFIDSIITRRYDKLKIGIPMKLLITCPPLSLSLTHSHTHTHRDRERERERGTHMHTPFNDLLTSIRKMTGKYS